MDALVNALVELPDGAVPGRAVLVEDGVIRAVVPEADVPTTARRFDLEGGRLAAGFIDLQVNGGGGVLFNDDPASDTIRRIAEAHRRFGTTSLLPTVITDRREVRAAAVEAVRAARAAGHRGIAGIHLEGPHLSERRRGVHAADRLARPEPADIDLLRRPGLGRVLVTLAPEAVTAADLDDIRATGAVVAIGHTDAGFTAVTAALDAGACGATHLFNAMSQLGSREPGAVGAVLSHPRAWAGIIADGHHVHWACVALAWRLMGRRLVLVSDAMPPVGAPPGTGFTLYGRPVQVAEGRCVTMDGTLAGSALDMATAVRNAVRHCGIPVSDALALASAAPADALGLTDRGRIAPGLRADLVQLDAELQVRRTWVAGVADPPAGSSPVTEAARRG